MTWLTRKRGSRKQKGTRFKTTRTGRPIHKMARARSLTLPKNLEEKIVSKAAGMPLEKLLGDIWFFADNKKVNGYFVTIEPWHDGCLIGANTNNLEAAQKKWLEKYRTDNPDKKIVSLKFTPSNFKFWSDQIKAEWGHEKWRFFGYTFLISR